jgi:hypothetical protein
MDEKGVASEDGRGPPRGPGTSETAWKKALDPVPSLSGTWTLENPGSFAGDLEEGSPEDPPSEDSTDVGRTGAASSAENVRAGSVGERPFEGSAPTDGVEVSCREEERRTALSSFPRSRSPFKALWRTGGKGSNLSRTSFTSDGVKGAPDGTALSSFSFGPSFRIFGSAGVVAWRDKRASGNLERERPLPAERSNPMTSSFERPRTDGGPSAY